MHNLTEVLTIGDNIGIDNDHFEDIGKKFRVKELLFRPNSSAVTVELIDENNNVHRRVVPYHQLYKVD